MINGKKIGTPRRYTYDQCLADAKHYQTKVDWTKASPALVSAAYRHGWFKKCTAHMKPAKKGTQRKHALETCRKSAKPYTNVTEWKEADAASYTAAKRYGWLSEVTKHFLPLGNQYRRLIYICRVRGTNLVYVGLTINFQKRISSHLTSLRFIDLIDLYGEKSIRFFKITNLINADSAAQFEDLLIQKYKSRGFKLLNRKGGGGLGASPHKWTYEVTRLDAARYETVGEWSIKSHAAYTAALEKDWINKFVSEGTIKRLKNEDGFWTLERIKQTALNSKTRKEWRTNYSVAYDKAVELGIHEDPELVSHFESSFKYKGQDNKIRAEIANYSTLKEFREGSPSLYSTLKKNKLLKKFTSNLIRARRKKSWSKEEIKKEALRHQTKSSFHTKGKGAYAAAKKLGCFEEVTKHIQRR